MKMSGFVFVFSSLSAFAVLLTPCGAHSATPVAASVSSSQPILASHKAVYSVTLTGTHPGGDYLDVNGQMLLEFTDACEAWTTNQKSVLHTISGDGTDARSSSDFTAWESKAGDNYTFSVRQTENGEVSEFRGRGKRNPTGDGGRADYTKPERKTYKLPPHFLFQTAQQVKLIELAQKGGHFLNGDMFDGSEGGGAARFNAIVLRPTAIGVSSSGGSSGASLKSPLLESPDHRVRVAFYAPSEDTDHDGSEGQITADSGEQPEYEMTMTVHDNGVVSDYDYDYQDFSVHGALVAIQPLPRPHC